ncbi:hypothetical protein SPWS13_4444 [Shewanella putrefaciens]|nr:hypothetical protein SPWS13_4444 [Shewanella putrefaciens]
MSIYCLQLIHIHLNAATAMAKVIGLGGIFFKSVDPIALATWYKNHLQVPIENWGGAAFYHNNKPTPGYHVWTPLAQTTHYFSPSDKNFMFNFIVDDLAQALVQVIEGVVSKSVSSKTLNLVVSVGLSTPMVTKLNYGSPVPYLSKTKLLLDLIKAANIRNKPSAPPLFIGYRSLSYLTKRLPHGKNKHTPRPIIGWFLMCRTHLCGSQCKLRIA